MFFTLFGYWAPGRRGSPKGLVPNLLMQFFTSHSSNIEFFETYFFDTMIAWNYLPRYIKHTLGRVYVVFTLFGYWAPRGGGGDHKGLVHNPRMPFFTLDNRKIEVFDTCF